MCPVVSFKQHSTQQVMAILLYILIQISDTRVNVLIVCQQSIKHVRSCTNLDGVSEAALKTQLCSKCRRAKYHSMECLKAAWLDGGHKTVSGA